MIIVNPNADYSGLGFGRAFAPITPEVESIMSNYSGANTKMAAALSLFFANIGATIKNKIKVMFLPLFSSTKNECFFTWPSSETRYPQSGNSNGLDFDNEKKLIQCNSLAADWQKVYYSVSSFFGTGETKEGTHGYFTIMVNTTEYTPQYSILGISFNKSGWAFGSIDPATFKKFRGISCHDVASDGTSGTAYNYTDTTRNSYSSYTSYGNGCYPFSNNHNAYSGEGVRICVGFKDTTLEEELILRSAMISLDNAFFN